jgi:hypothetical protein
LKEQTKLLVWQRWGCPYLCLEASLLHQPAPHASLDRFGFTAQTTNKLNHFGVHLETDGVIWCGESKQMKLIDADAIAIARVSQEGEIV